MGFKVRIFRGDAPTLIFTFTEQGGQPLDLSGWTLYFAAAAEDGTLLIDKQMSVIDPLQGKASVMLSSTETARAGVYKAEVEARKGDTVLTLIQGYLVIVEDVRK